MTSNLQGQGHSGLPLQLLRVSEKFLLLFYFKVNRSDDDNVSMTDSEHSKQGQRPPPPRRPPHPPGGKPPVAHTPSATSLAASEISAGGLNNPRGETGSIASGANSQSGLNLSDMLDHRIDRILKEWHQSSDLLFSVHPVDGSLLVWMADFLDEYMPGSFRQAQVCTVISGFNEANNSLNPDTVFVKSEFVLK